MPWIQATKSAGGDCESDARVIGGEENTKAIHMGRPKKDTQPSRLTVTLDEQDYEKVCTLAQENDVSAAWVIRRAVHDYLGRAQVPPPPARSQPKAQRGRA
jgi:hypothetical protein